MNYQKIYDRIISRGRERVLAGYKEHHHIIPRCMGGTDHPDNLVHLTPEEHYVCHQLLVKIYPKNIKLLHAIQAMTMSGSAGIRSNKKYSWLKRNHSILKRTGIFKKCSVCNCEFYARLNRLDKPFCSRLCFNNANTSDVECLNCKKTFRRANSLNTSKEKFCSKQCKIEHKSYIFNCKTCLKQVRVPMCRLKQGIPTYCSRKCKGNCR